MILILYIVNTPYVLSRLDEPASAWRLTKSDGELYDCHEDKHGLHCTCADHTFKKAKIRQGMCKHLAALQELRLI